MRKKITSIIRKSAASLLLAATASVPWQTADADMLMNDNFDYESGNLYEKGGWMKYGSNPEGPIQVLPNSLTYPGYQTASVGGKAEIKSTVTGEDLYKFFDNDAMVKEGKMYVSFLLNVKSTNKAKAYFFAANVQTKNGLGDGKSGSDYFKIYVTDGSAGDKFKISIAGTAAITKSKYVDGEFNTGETYLVVACYNFADNTYSLWINPQSTDVEPAKADASDSEGTAVSITNGGFKALQLRQGASSSNPGADLEIDALRAATTWAELFQETAGPVVETPTISLSSNTVNIPLSYPESVMTTSVKLYGQYLKGDVTVLCPDGMECVPATITAEEANSEDGVELNFSFTTPVEGGAYTRTVTFASEEAQEAVLTIKGEVLEVTNIPNAAQIDNIFTDPNHEEKTYRYMGKAVVTYVDKVKEGTYEIYAQDMFGAIKINTSFTAQSECQYKQGDELTDVFFIADKLLGAPVMYAMPTSMDGSFGKLLATDKSKTPSDVTIADMSAATLPTNIYKLLKVSNVHIQDAEGKKFEAGKNYTISDGEKTAVVRVFAGSDLIGTDIPTGTISVTGISGSTSIFSLNLRSAADIEIGAASVSITPKKVFDFTNDAAPVRQQTEIYQYTVVAENLPEAAPVRLTGTNADQFLAIPSEIPAGSGTTVVKVMYDPNSVGMHKGGIFFDFDKINAEFNYTASFGNCKAYDPDNLPSVTIEPKVVDLSAAPGETVTATVTLNAANAFDYITASRAGQGDNGGISINNTYLPADSENVTITITFAPKEEGEYSETWTYTTTKCEAPATITVNAVCEGKLPPEEDEGEEGNVDFSNPLSWYVQTFSTVEKNKPLRLEGWKNVTVEGTRAWWGYEGETDGVPFYAAKVTAYDSKYKPGKGTPCEMMLISPALDYKNAKSKMLRFRLMGEFLNEKTGDVLDICLIKESETEPGEYEAYNLDGFNIPATADEAGEWISYDVDMTNVSGMPDVFCIAFAFSGTRGVDNTTTYYITDFSWSEKSEGIDGISITADAFTADADGYYNVYTLQGIRVLRTKNIEELQTLPAGLYLTNGCKFIKK